MTVRSAATEAAAARVFASSRGAEALRDSLRRDPPRRILIMAPSALGDALMSSGAVHAIIARFPEAHITLETSRRTMPLFDNFPGIDARRTRTDRFEKLASTLWLRRQPAFDLGILLDNYRGRAQIMRWGGVRRTAGIRERMGERWLQASVCWDPGAHDKFDPLLALLTLLEAKPDVRPRIYPTAADAAAATDAFRRTTPAPRVGIFAGASAEKKQWPLDRFITLAQRLERSGISVIALSVLGDDGVMDALRAGGLRIAPVLPHPLVLAEYLKQLDVLVANDSGPAHLAAAAGVATAVIYVATLPERGAPYGERTSLVHAGQDCDVYAGRCEGLQQSGRCDRRCQTAIDVDRVYDATVRLLALHAKTVHDHQAADRVEGVQPVGPCPGRIGPQP